MAVLHGEQFSDKKFSIGKSQNLPISERKDRKDRDRQDLQNSEQKR